MGSSGKLTVNCNHFLIVTWSTLFFPVINQFVIFALPSDDQSRSLFSRSTVVRVVSCLACANRTLSFINPTNSYIALPLQHVLRSMQCCPPNTHRHAQGILRSFSALPSLTEAAGLCSWSPLQLWLPY